MCSDDKQLIIFFNTNILKKWISVVYLQKNVTERKNKSNSTDRFQRNNIVENKIK